MNNTLGCDSLRLNTLVHRNILEGTEGGCNYSALAAVEWNSTVNAGEKTRAQR